MNKKQSLTVVSVSALTAGMAHGAVIYSGLVNTSITASGNTSFDLNADGTPDFTLEFNSSNFNKPFIQGYPDVAPGSTPLAQLASDGWYGLPVTPFGTVINSSFLTPVPDTSPSAPGQAYMNQDNNSTINTIGTWGANNITEGYVGLEMYDNTGLSQTNFGWVRLIYNQTAKTMTLVDYGYETITGEAIFAGQTNELGAPNIYNASGSQTAPVGSTVQLNVVAYGSPNPIYQWRAGAVGHGVFTNLNDAGNISGSASNTLTISGITPGNMADYEVMVSNSLGFVTTVPATLTVVTPSVGPTPQVLFSGLTAHIGISVSGLTPTYRWQKGGVALTDNGRVSGSATANLAISGLQTTDSANYTVILTNGSLVITSAPAALTVLPQSSASLFDTAVLAAGPVAYYRFAETGNPATNNLIAYDNAGALNGVYGLDVTNSFSGVAGPRPSSGFPGFLANNAAALFTPNDTNSQITVAPWNLNSVNATFTCWVNPPAIQNFDATILWAGTNNNTYAGMNYYYSQGTGVEVPGNVDLGYTWNQGGSAAFEFWDSGIMPATNDWSFVAMVFTPSTVGLYVYNNDEADTWTNATFPAINVEPGDNNIFPFTNQAMAFATSEFIGNNPFQAGGAYGFNGAICDMAAFNQALTQDQLTAMYNAALGVPPGLTVAVVAGSVQVTWPLGTLVQSTNVYGPWTAVPSATSPYTVPPGSPPNNFYRLLLY